MSTQAATRVGIVLLSPPTPPTRRAPLGRRSRALTARGATTLELWRLPGGGDLLVMGRAWDSRRDAAEFAAAVR